MPFAFYLLLFFVTSTEQLREGKVRPPKSIYPILLFSHAAAVLGSNV